MDKLRRRVEELLWVCGLHRVSAPLWEAARGGKARRQSRLMRDFYTRLLPKGALIFDVGANVGTLTRIFAALGGRVVAVEPNPDCVRHIELTTSRKSVEVLQAAVGEASGLATLRVSDKKDKMSSLSGEWREAVLKENQDYGGLWNRDLTVPMITLDAMTEQYGMPFYIKIDVEGYEEHALKGISRCPPLLSFEFNGVFLDSAMQALRNPIFDGASFNYTLVDPVKFELGEWVDRGTLEKTLAGLPESQRLGDIFVRKKGAT